MRKLIALMFVVLLASCQFPWDKPPLGNVGPNVFLGSWTTTTQGWVSPNLITYNADGTWTNTAYSGTYSYNESILRETYDDGIWPGDWYYTVVDANRITLLLNGKGIPIYLSR